MLFVVIIIYFIITLNNNQGRSKLLSRCSPCSCELWRVCRIQLQNRTETTGTKSETPQPMQQSASDSGFVDRRQPSLDDQRQRHVSGPMIGLARSGSGVRGAPLSSGALHKSGSTILRRIGRTESTDRPFDMPTSRSSVSFSVDKVETMGSRKSMTSRATRTTVVSRAEYHGDLKPAIVAVSITF